MASYGPVFPGIRPKIPVSPQGERSVVSETKIGPGADSGVPWYTGGRENAACPAKRKDLGGVTMMTERYEDGRRIISVDTKE